MRTAKENGAVAVHIAHSNPASCELWRHFPGTQRTNGFALLRAPTVIACDMLMMSDLPQMFPSSVGASSRHPLSGAVVDATTAGSDYALFFPVSPHRIDRLFDAPDGLDVVIRTV